MGNWLFELTRAPALVAVLLLVSSAFGCDGNDERSPLQLSVETELKFDGGEHCYAPCEGSTTPSAALPDQCDAGIVSCGFGAGAGTLRVSARYGVDVATSTELESPVLELISGSTKSELATSFDISRQAAKKGKYKPVAVAVLPTPLSPTSSLRFRVTVEDSVSRESLEKDNASYFIHPALASVRIAECSSSGSTCEVASGTASVTLVVTAPIGFVGRTVNIETSIDGVIQLGTSFPPVMLARDGDQAGGSARIPAGQGVGRLWQVHTVLDGQRSSVAARLVDPGPLALGLAASNDVPDVTNADIPQRAQGEPTRACRTYNLKVAVPSAGDAREATLKASAGRLGGGGTNQQLALNERGEAETTLELPDDLGADSVQVFLASDTREFARDIPLQKILPIAGFGPTRGPEQQHRG